MAVIASFSSGVLSVLGDSLNNTITGSRNAAGNILVNGGAVNVLGGTPSVANTALISVFGQGGNDTLLLNETNGALPAANMFGGAGNDTMTGGSGGNQLHGQSGDDTLLGKGGTDLLFGGADDDTLTGGDGDDQVFGQSGNDRMIWNAGDDTDLFEGGAGIDTAEVNAGNGAETFTIAASGARVRFDRVDPAPPSLNIGTTENLVVDLNGGNDVISVSGNLAPLIKLTIDGGAGNDTITGGNGGDLLLGGDGNDIIDGNQGSDVARLGAGNDTFVWNAGDGNDAVEGQAGIDKLVFNTNGAADIIGIAASGERVRVTRNVGSVSMNIDDVETLRVNAGGGADKITVGDLSGTAVGQVAIDLAGTIGGTKGDGQVDSVTIKGSKGNNPITVLSSGSTVTVNGLPAQVVINRAEAKDQLTINGLTGNDTINAGGLTATSMALTIDGGAGNDTITGGAGKDRLLGGDGNDTVIGRKGNDVAFLGAGNDTFIWNPGDGNDVVEGQAGTDTLAFNGSASDESIDVSANGQRVKMFSNVGSVTMDVNGVETLRFNASGGMDTVTVGDLSGTAATKLEIDLAATIGGGTGDGKVDRVVVNGTNANNAITVQSSGSSVFVNGLSAQVTIAKAEAADQLTINGLAGDDTIDATAMSATSMVLTVDAEAGHRDPDRCEPDGGAKRDLGHVAGHRALVVRARDQVRPDTGGRDPPMLRTTSSKASPICTMNQRRAQLGHVQDHLPVGEVDDRVGVDREVVGCDDEPVVGGLEPVELVKRVVADALYLKSSWKGPTRCTSGYPQSPACTPRV